MYSSYQSDPTSEFLSEQTSRVVEDLPASTSKKSFSNVFKLISAVAAVALIVMVGLANVSSNVTNSMTKLFSLRKSFSDDSSTFTISVTSSHPDYGSYDDLDGWVPWDAIVEPHNVNTLTIDEAIFGDESLDTSAYTFTWFIGQDVYEGSTIQHIATTTGVTTAKIVATNIVDPTVSYTATMTIASKYVRREVRTLTDADRTALLDAMQTLYKVSTTDGKALYGDNYISSADLLMMHLNGAGRTDCDHWHDGAGIVNQHVAISMIFERAIQAINPKLSLAYWEYAEDAYNFDHWYESSMFQDDWFGVAAPTSADHSINTGRWAFTEVPDASYLKDSWSTAETGSLNPFVNGYGHMRSAWNNNPSKYLSRYNKTYGVSVGGDASTPNCEQMSKSYDQTSLARLLNGLNGVSHGPMHVVLGGAWSKTDDDVSILKSIDRVLLFKMLWRTGYTRCPTSCDADEICSCSIPEEYMETYGLQTILENAGLYTKISGIVKMSTDEGMETARKAVEDPGIAGEMYSSAASFDPSFWPLHGQLERVLGLKRIMVEQGISESFDETWGFYVSDDRYLQGRCDWSNVTDASDLTLPTCDYSEDYYCWGHEEDDEIANTNFLGSGNFKNGEFYDYIHPWTDELSYIYDTYKFDYCTDQGYNFGYNTDSSTKKGKMTRRSVSKK